MKRLFAIILFIGLLIEPCYPQDASNSSHSINISIPEVAILDIEGNGGNSITLSPTFSGEAGDGLDFGTVYNNDLWLNYTSILPNEGTSRIISVQVDNISLLKKMKLNLAATSPTGMGILGTMHKKKSFQLKEIGTDFITGIGNAYTLDGVGNGIQLTYSLDFKNIDFNGLTAFSNTITVTYTIVDK